MPQHGGNNGFANFVEAAQYPKKVKKQHWLKGKLYLLENVTGEVCTNCGERYFHARVLDQIDKILQNEHKVEKCIQVEVVNF